MSNHQSQQDIISSSVLSRLPFPPSPRPSPVTPTCSQFIAHGVDSMALAHALQPLCWTMGICRLGECFSSLITSVLKNI